MTSLFFSYSHANKDFVRPLATELQELGIDVWIDTQLIGGTLWSPEIVTKITTADFFILFISDSSVKSANVRREVDVAFGESKKVIPLRLERVEIPREWKFQLAGIQWIERDDPKWKSKLLIAIGASKSSIQPAEKQKALPVDAAKAKAVSATSAVEPKSPGVPQQLARVIEIFGRNFVKTAECDKASSCLREVANTLSMKQEYLYLQLALKEKLLTLANRVDDFRKVCSYGSSQADRERKGILKELETVQTKLNGILEIM